MPIETIVQAQGAEIFAQYTCVVDGCEIVAEIPMSELPAPNPDCPVHEHKMMLLAGWRLSHACPVCNGCVNLETSVTVV